MTKKTISKTIVLVMILMFVFSSAALADDELLKRGDSSDNVAFLQRLLMEKGYFNYNTITGYYGVITEDAVKAFQRDTGLRVDGVTGAATWATLLSGGEVNTQDPDEAETPIEIVTEETIFYSIGMECADIALIQTRLNDLGFYNYDYVTGYFGSITQNAVMSFQKSCSLQSNGIVDKTTWDMLFSDYTPISLQPGSANDAVIPLQSRLAELGYYSFSIDGHYGPKTQEAVIYFQKASGITANGVADALTQEMLFSSNAISEQQARRKITSQTTSGANVSAATPRTEDIVEIAKQYLGYPYVYGASGPDAFDCDGYIAYIYDLAGITLPDNSYDNYGTRINDRLDLRVGDLVFFDTLFVDGNLADHVGIYIGDGKFIHVDTRLSKREVSIDSMTLDNGWYTARFVWGIRIIEP